MEAIIEKCCGLDVHQASVVACVLVGEGQKRPKKEVRTFRTVGCDLRAMRDWLGQLGITHVAMESTGIYWVPVFRMLEGSFEIVVGNAQHIKNVPGRKTDVKDSEWIAHLVRCGLIRPSFVPPLPIRELRELTRFRRSLMNDQARIRNRVQKLLETASIKLSSVASDVFGTSGRAMLRALADGETDAAVLAQLAKSVMRRKIPALVEAFDGNFEPHHRFLLRFQLERLDEAERSLTALDQHIEEKLVPYKAELELLAKIPGFDRTVAASFIAETGADMSVFPTSRHLAAWTGVAPGNNETGGKHRQAGARKGNVHLTTTLVQAALGAVRKRGSYYKDKYWRLRTRRGAMRAMVAIAHKLLVAAYEVLSAKTAFVDLGDQYLTRRSQTDATRKLVHRLEALGFDVALTPRDVAEQVS
jgi:transposase